MSLKPQNLIQAAEADLKRRIRNTAAELTTYEHYAFHRSHVRKAKCARELLLLALMHPPLKNVSDADVESSSEVGQLATAKANTRLIYGNGGLLVEALRMLT